MKCEICGAELMLSDTECKYCGNKVIMPSGKTGYANNTDESYLDTPKSELRRRQEEIYSKMCKHCGRDLNPHTNRCDFCDEQIANVTKKENDLRYIKETEMAKRQTNSRNNTSSGTYSRRRTTNTKSRQSSAANTRSRQNTKSKKRRNPIVTALMITLSMILLFAISFTVFFKMLDGNLSKKEEEMPTQTPKPTAQVTRVVQTPQPSEKNTKKPETTEKAKPDKTEKPQKTEEPQDEVRETEPAKTQEAVEENEIESTQSPTQTGIQTGKNSYAYPSDEQVITQSELEGMTRQEIKIVLQEIYARHGYTFNEDDLIEYFEGKNWYIPTETDIDAVEAKFSDTELENKEIIEEYQKEQGWRI